MNTISQDASAAARITSFGFLTEEDHSSESQYGIGQLLSKVKTVFTGSASSASSGIERPPEAQQQSLSTRLAAEARSQDDLDARKSDQTRQDLRIGIADPSNPLSDGLDRKNLGGTPHPKSANPSASLKKLQRVGFSPKESTAQGSSASHVPSALRTSFAAPAVTSLASTIAVAQRGGGSSPIAEEYDDTSSIRSFNEETLPSSGRLGPRSSIATLVSHIRLPSASIPGFPLSKDILADDAQSTWSLPSRSPGSEGGLDNTVGQASSASLRTSAEAFRRLTLKGGASHSKEWWMPDESAKECSACGNQFGIARRRHHCRCCGQIFCSSCASNLLPGSKLGLPGVVRVCDFCTRMMRQYDLARASGQGGLVDTANASGNVRVRAEMISAPLEAAVENAPQSRFAANALFGASSFARDGSQSPTGHSPSHAPSRPALNTVSSSGSIDFHPSRSQTPDLTALSEARKSDFRIAAPSGSTTEAQAPFRRGLAEEDQAVGSENPADDTTVDATAKQEDALETSDSPPPLALSPAGTPEEAPKATSATSSIAFPSTSQGSPSKAVARNALDQARARLASDASISQESRARLVSDAAIRAFRRSRLRSRLNTNESLVEKGHHNLASSRDNAFQSDSRPSSRLGSSGAQGLERESLEYLRRLLDQCLSRAEIANKEEWMTILLPLTLKVIQSVKPSSSSRGKSMGVRRLVKIKRIAGGTPQDSHAIDGYICSRNVASKAMIRRLPLHNARVAMLSFPLTAVKGEGHYVSLDALTASEREYTRIMVARVLSLRPHLLIVRDQVSRMALDILEQAGIVVVWKVPESSMSSIARVTQTDIVTSLDRLALRPRLGRCGLFAVDSYHSMMLPGKRRSFLRFTGTPKELGSSIILRGGGLALLAKIKAVLEFCLLAAHNLQLEEAMRNIDLALLPEPRGNEDELSAEDGTTEQGMQVGHEQSLSREDEKVESVDAAHAEVVSALESYRSTLFSVSARLQIPPPYPLIRLQKEQATLTDLQLELQSSEEMAKDEDVEIKPTQPDTSADEKAIISFTEEKQMGHTPAESEMGETTVNEASAGADKMECDVAAQLVESDITAAAQQGLSQLSLDEKMDVEKQVQAILPSSVMMNLQTRLAVARSRHAFDLKFLPSLIGAGQAGLTPFLHQRLSVLHSFVNSATLKPCIGPRIEQMDFYGKDDHTLGDFLGSKCAGSSQVCKARQCGLQQILHYDSFIHHQIRIQCFCERFVCPIAGQELSILTWEYCKICETATPVSVVNETAKAYSWAKFLESHFYTKFTRSSCTHVSLVDRIRYFAYKNLAFRIHVEQVEPFDVVVPGLRLFMRPDIQSTLKAEESLGFARRADAYFHSVAARLKALQYEVESCRDLPKALEQFWPQMQEIHSVALSGRQEVNTLLVSEVSASGPGDTLCLNKVRQKLQGIVVKIDELFGRLERLVLPKEKDLRRLHASQLGGLFIERETLYRSASPSIQPESSIAPVVESSNADGLPQSHTNNSLSALAMIADSAAFGLPTHLGISFEETPMVSSEITSAAASGATTPTTLGSSSTTKALSSTLINSVGPSPPGTVSNMTAPIPAGPTLADDHLAASPELPAHRPKDEGGQKRHEDSDGLSSPSDRLKPLSRPKARKGKMPSGFPSTVTDSSCTEAGESTDGGRLGQSLVRNLNLLSSTSNSKRPSAVTDRQPSGGVARASRQQVLSDGDSRPSTCPTSPIDRRLRHPVPFTRTQSSSIVEQSTTSSMTSSRGSQRTGLAPPSSYRPPPVRRNVRVSESESDAPIMKRIPQSRSRAGPSAASSGRPPLSRRTSAKSDSGSESQSQLPPRNAKRSGNRAGQMTSLPPIAVPRTPSRVPIPTSVAGGLGRVSTIAHHFDRINRHAEKERERQRRALALRARRALPIATSSARIAEYSSVSAAVESDESSEEDDADDDEDEVGSRSDGEEADSERELDAAGNASEGIGASLADRIEVLDREKGMGIVEAGSSDGIQALTATDNSLAPSDRAVDSGVRDKDAPPTPSVDASGLERGSLLKTISSFWASRAGVALPLLEYPLSGEQHLFADSPLLLREDEPSSTIAFTLVSAKYQERLRHLRASRKSVAKEPQASETSIANWDLTEHRDLSNEDVESSLRQPEGVHLRFDFESGASRFHCRILFSEQFDALRRCCGCEDSFITSLARCLKWDSSGGKSGMTFLKTRDDRLVLKQLSSSELTSFSSFAPHYFAHMTDCLMHGKPTTLAKIFGLFRISMRNQATGKSYKLDVLVMEHLFYGRQCSRIFDLKGSMRNRYVKETGAPGEVLQDENLVEISLQRPLFIREGSKIMLRQALMHDSQFLADMNIMDYSVIVGIDTSDDENHELVVGIIDFLRSYTWDKRVETFVKEQSFLTGAAKGELPTVITPKQYAQRFLNFLDGILLLSPDAWYRDTPQGPSPHNSNSASTSASAAPSTTGGTTTSNSAGQTS